VHLTESIGGPCGPVSVSHVWSVSIVLRTINLLNTDILRLCIGNQYPRVTAGASLLLKKFWWKWYIVPRC